MSRPTPETDAKAEEVGMGHFMVDSDFSRKLERERDEAREKYFVMRDLSNNAAELAEKYKQERDEAREEVKLWQRERDEAITRRMETIMQCELYEQERDEARENLRILAGLVAYGLGQSGEEWSLDAMRQATDAIQKAKALEGVK